MTKRKRENEQSAAPLARKPSASVDPPRRAVSPYLSYLIGFGVVILIAAAVGGLAFMKSQQAPQAPPAEPASKPAPPPAPTHDNTPLRDFKVVNAHEHLMARKFLDKYLSAAQETGVLKTLFVASSDYTLKGSKFEQTAGNDENTGAILAAAREFPDKIVPYCTIHPGDPDKLDKIRKYVAEGAKGLKLYTGHGSFYDRPLDAPDMLAVYAYCEETRLPICWHVNIVKYAAEFERVMVKFPKLIVIVPHFGVTFFRPREAPFQEFQRLMDAYPYLYTDTSFGTRNILIDGLEAVSRDPQPFRDFIAKYSDRVLFGTDMVITGNKEKSEQWIADVIRACREVLERDSYSFYMGAKGSPYASKSSQNEKGVFRGLALDDATLRKIYETNFDHLMALCQPPPKN
jgi:predicted TIM-barrel fold metal-dependent hydrolase